jgi:hypothetical protein
VSPYPIAVSAAYEGQGRNRLTAFFRYLIAIPWAFVAGLYLVAAAVLAVIAWFAIAFGGRYPSGLYGFNVKVLRTVTRVNGFQLLLTDELPRFDGDPDDAYPIQVAAMPALPRYSRPQTLLRLVLAIPVVLLAYVQNVIAAACSVVAWFAILFTGRLPEGLYRGIRGAVAYETRTLAYLLLMTEDYPPFGYDEAIERSAGAAPYPAA